MVRVTYRGAYVISTPVLNAFAIAVGLVIPGLLGPADFGRYVVVELFSRYLVIADLGLGQILDRRIPPLVVRGDNTAVELITQHVLWARVLVAGTCGIVVLSLTCYLALSRSLQVNLAAAIFSSAFGMLNLVASGPVAAWRAASRYKPFCLSSIFLNIGLSVPRVMGAWLGGVVGCFMALALWYGLGAAVVQSQLPLRRSAFPSIRSVCVLLRESVPLFAAGFGWTLYIIENRLVYATIAGSAELGQFAFGSSVLTVLVTTIGTACNVYYPRLAGTIATAARFSQSGRLMRDLALLAIAGFVCSGLAIELAPKMIEFLYPHYIDSLPATRMLLVSGPSVIVSSWLMPIVVAVGRRPWTDALSIFPPSLLAVAAGIIIGNADGMAGAAMGSVAGTLVCPVLQLVALRRSSVMLLRHAAALSLLIAAIMGILAAVTRSF
jgi:O-antigen/teichoic acid export membrane protein